MWTYCDDWLLESLDLYTKLNQIISSFMMSCLRVTKASGPSPKHTSSSRWCKPLSSHLLLNERRLIFHKSLNFLLFLNRRKYLERWLVTAVKRPPGASETFLVVWDKALYECGRRQNNGSCSVAKWEFTHVGLLRWWKWEASTPWTRDRTPWKRRALVYQFAFNITKMRWRALQRSGLFYLASKLRAHHSPSLLSLFPVEVKVGVNICRASPPWRENKIHVCMSDSLVWKTSLKAYVHSE